MALVYSLISLNSSKRNGEVNLRAMWFLWVPCGAGDWWSEPGSLFGKKWGNLSPDSKNKKDHSPVSLWRIRGDCSLKTTLLHKIHLNFMKKSSERITLKIRVTPLTLFKMEGRTQFALKSYARCPDASFGKCPIWILHRVIFRLFLKEGRRKIKFIWSYSSIQGDHSPVKNLEGPGFLIEFYEKEWERLLWILFEHSKMN